MSALEFGAGRQRSSDQGAERRDLQAEEHAAQLSTGNIDLLLS